MMLRQVVSPEAGGLRRLNNCNPLGVGSAQWLRAHIQVIKDAEFDSHSLLPYMDSSAFQAAFYLHSAVKLPHCRFSVYSYRLLKPRQGFF